MRMGTAVLVLGLIGAACSSGSALVADGPLAIDAPRTVDAAVDAPGAIDAGVVDASVAQACLAARDAWRARFALVDTTCTDPSDCGLTPRGDGLISCNGTPTIGTACEGAAARKTALDAAAAELDALQAAWRTACQNSCSLQGYNCFYDCGPGHPECIQGHCVTQANACPDNCLCFAFPDAGT